MSKEETNKKVRGKGKKPALVHINVRVPPDVLEFYKDESPEYTVLIRQVLTDYAAGKIK